MALAELIPLSIEIANKRAFTGLAVRWREIQKQALRDTAEFWHEKILPKHFGGRNRSEYGYDPRRPFYLQVIKPLKGQGAGRFTDLLLKGASYRQLATLFRITGSAQQATLTMQAPRYFTNPFIGTFTDKRTGKLKRITRQPDKPGETTRMSPADFVLVRDFATQRLDHHLAGQLFAGGGI